MMTLNRSHRTEPRKLVYGQLYNINKALNSINLEEPCNLQITGFLVKRLYLNNTKHLLYIITTNYDYILMNDI